MNEAASRIGVCGETVRGFLLIIDSIIFLKDVRVSFLHFREITAMNIVMYVIPKIWEEGKHDIPKGDESDQV